MPNKTELRTFPPALLALGISAAAIAPVSADLLGDTVARFDIANLTGPSQQYMGGYDTVALPHGQFAVVWSIAEANSGTRLQLQRFNSGGNAVGGVVTLQQSSLFDASVFAWLPHIAADKSGNMVVAWFLDDGIDVSLVSNSNTVQSITPPGEEVDEIYGIEVSMDDDGDFAVLWATGQSEYDAQLFVQTYLADGSKVINTPFKPAISNLPGDVLMLPNSQLLLAWSSDGAANNESSGSTVKAQKYDFSGNTIGASFRLDNNTNGNLSTQVRPKLIDDANGGFVAAWHESDDAQSVSGNSIQVRGQRWRADGSSGAALLLGQYEFSGGDTRGFTAPSIGSDSEGNLLATWVQDPDHQAPSLADGTAFDSNNRLIGERQFNFADMTTAGVGSGEYGDSLVAMSDDLTAIVWSEDGLRLQARVMPGLVENKNGGSGGSLSWLLSVTIGLLGWVRTHRQRQSSDVLSND